MKTIAALFCAVLVMGATATTFAAAPDTANMPYCIMRGFSNMLLGWTEVPRGLVYENVRMPGIGLVSGTLKGTFLGFWREVSGCVDVMTFGVTGEGTYLEEMPDFVWECPCVPTKEETKAEAE